MLITCGYVEKSQLSVFLFFLIITLHCLFFSFDFVFIFILAFKKSIWFLFMIISRATAFS